jgi:transposase
MSQYEDNTDEDALVSVLRHQNRAQRSLVKQLRRLRKEEKEHSHELFEALLDTDPQAEAAFRELWMRGEFDCSPSDYQMVVEECLRALAVYRRISTHIPALESD